MANEAKGPLSGPVRIKKLEDLSPRILSDVFQASPDWIMIVALDGQLEFINESGLAAMEIDRFSAVQGHKWCLLWPEEARMQVDAAMGQALQGKAARLEAFCPTVGKNARWWDVTVSPVKDGAGAIECILFICRDITDRVIRERQLTESSEKLSQISSWQSFELERNAEMLQRQKQSMKEVDHRVRNSLAMVAAILGIQGQTSSSAETRQALQEASTRVRTIGWIHERLYKGNDIERVDTLDFMESLARNITSTSGPADVSLELKIASHLVPFDVAAALGLILTELLGNALYHGFASGQAGVLKVTYETCDGRWVLTVEDNGVGLPAEFDLQTAQGVGSLILRSYAARLSGVIEHESEPGRSTRFCLSFPASSVA